jgi:O-antigen ligase
MHDQSVHMPKTLESQEKQNPALVHACLYWLFVIFLVSVVFSLRAISSISIGLILLAGLARLKIKGEKFFKKDPLNVFVLGCVLLYVAKCFALLYTHNMHEGLKHLQKTSALVFVPLAMYVNISFVNRTVFKKLFTWLAFTIAIAAFYCLCIAFKRYTSGAPSIVFFYFDLVKPLSQHAIQLSIICFICLIFLCESTNDHSFSLPGKAHIALIIFLSVFLFLLSSKLILVFYIAYLIYFFSRKMPFRKTSRGLRYTLIGLSVIAVALIFTTKNPIENRFRDIVSGDFDFYKRERFSQANYFNGLQFRLLQWRFVSEIMHETNSWMLGLSPGDAQSYLDQKYISTNMYQGKPGTDQRGFLGYHTHNQFLQSFLQNGIPGLALFLLACFGLIQMMRVRRNVILNITAVLLLLYCFTDAILETQYGLVIFTFFPALVYLRGRASTVNRESSIVNRRC